MEVNYLLIPCTFSVPIGVKSPTVEWSRHRLSEGTFLLSTRQNQHTHQILSRCTDLFVNEEGPSLHKIFFPSFLGGHSCSHPTIHFDLKSIQIPASPNHRIWDRREDTPVYNTTAWHTVFQLTCLWIWVSMGTVQTFHCMEDLEFYLFCSMLNKMCVMFLTTVVSLTLHHKHKKRPNPNRHELSGHAEVGLQLQGSTAQVSIITTCFYPSCCPVLTPPFTAASP